MIKRLPRRRWFQFRLITLFMIVTASSVVIAWWSRPFERDVEIDDPRFECFLGMSEAEVEAYKAQKRLRRQTCWFYRHPWKGPVRHGVETFWDAQGHKQWERRWCDGTLSGPAKDWDEDGNIASKGEYHDGDREGTWSEFDSRGTMVAYTEYRCGQRVRTTVADPQVEGDVLGLAGATLVCEWRDDVPIRQARYSATGVKIEEVEYRDGHRHGLAAGWFPDGQPRYEGPWQNDCEQGDWTWWNDVGRSVGEAAFNEGYLVLPGGRVSRPYVSGRLSITNDGCEVPSALFEKSELDFTDQPLRDVLDYLSSRHEVPLEVDHFVVDEDFLNDETVTMTSYGIALHEGLLDLLGPHGLTYVVHDGSIWITRTEAGARFAQATLPRQIAASARTASLDQIVDVKFDAMCLRDVLDWLYESYGIAARPEAEAEAGALLDIPITAQIYGLSLGAALDVALHRHGLAYYLDDDDIVIEPADQGADP
jgi:antitoxin component YwqK of YwqJK toxin-antitoxin module